MTCYERQNDSTKARRWSIPLIALLFVLSGGPASAAKEAQPTTASPNPRVSAPTKNPFRIAQNRIAQNQNRIAQNTDSPPTHSRSPGEFTQSLGQGSEALPAPPPANPNRSPVQHVIPFAKPDPNAEIIFKQENGLISLTVHDSSLRRTIAMIAEAHGLNIVFAASADIGITASLDGVPWDQALDYLLSSSGYTWSNNDGIIFVSSLEAANFMAPGAGGRQTQIFELDFVAASDVDQATKGLLSPGGQSWISESSSSDSRHSRESIVVFDFPTHLQRIEDYIAQIDQPPRQVMIEANILQVDLNDDCRNGVNFEALAKFQGNELELSTVGFANPSASSAVFLEATGTALTGLVELLQTTTDAKTLASPRLLVVSGQEARIQIGEKLGFRVTTTTQTSSLESVQFLDVGVVLTVEPRITRDGRVLMRINPKVSTGQVVDDLPSEETTEVETDILLSDGQGMVIGGLIQEQDSIALSKIPWAGDLPYAGVLFQKRKTVKTRSEIIVTLIPRVQPYSPSVASRDSMEVMRTQQKLTHGPLNLVPRPYEPRLPDAITNPLSTGFSRRQYSTPAERKQTPFVPFARNGNHSANPKRTPSTSVRLSSKPASQAVWIDDAQSKTAARPRAKKNFIQAARYNK